MIKPSGADFKYDRVMIIDDNNLDNFITSKLIEKSKFAKKVYVHTSAESALEFLKNIQVAGLSRFFSPEVIIVDLNMPIMDGLEFLDHYKTVGEKENGSLKLVILTSSVAVDDELMARKKEPDIIFLRKPLTIEMLMSI